MTTLERAIEVYGKDMQLTVAVEELSELIKELCKNKRGNENREAIIEELADCNIMMSQIEIIFNIRNAEVTRKVIEKTERLEKRLEETYEEELDKLKAEKADVTYFKSVLKADTVRKVQDSFALHFGTYTDTDTVKVVDVFKLLTQIEKEVLEEGDK